MVSVEELSEAAFKASVWEEAELAEGARRLLLEERRTGRSKDGLLRVEGGLVRLPAQGELIVVGDLHGDFESLAFILEDSGFLRRAEAGEEVTILFLGDYGDRGPNSPEIYHAICRLKVEFAGRVVLLRGNHEPPGDLTPIPFDLPYQLHEKFGEAWEEAYGRILELHEALPQAALAEGKYLLLHGGVPSKLKSIEDLAHAHERHPSESLLEEILWSDPDENLSGVAPSPRGAGLLFGPDVTRRALEVVGAKTLIRGHEPVGEGVHAGQGGLTLTLFSRKGPPYFNRYAAYLKVSLEEPAKNAYQLAQQAVKF